LSTGPIEFPIEGLSDGSVRLRLIAEADLAAIVAACQDPEIARWTHVPDPYTDADARHWSDEQDRLRREGSELHLLVVEDDTDRLLGAIGLTVDAGEGRGVLGYWVAAEARGSGVASRAVRLLASWALDELELGRVQLNVEPENEASLRVAESTGFTREGMLRSYAVIKGRRRDMVVFSLLPGDLPGEGSPGKEPAAREVA
jgi:RimJ/RimL family protein N-acetyltransferase